MGLLSNKHPIQRIERCSGMNIRQQDSMAQKNPSITTIEMRFNGWFLIGSASNFLNHNSPFCFSSHLLFSRIEEELSKSYSNDTDLNQHLQISVGTRICCAHCLTIFGGCASRKCQESSCCLNGLKSMSSRRTRAKLLIWISPEYKWGTLTL